ncbi:unnamed protein product [Ectocarpus sp. 12 AP-2014]
MGRRKGSTPAAGAKKPGTKSNAEKKSDEEKRSRQAAAFRTVMGWADTTTRKRQRVSCEGATNEDNMGNEESTGEMSTPTTISDVVRGSTSQAVHVVRGASNNSATASTQSPSSKGKGKGKARRERPVGAAASEVVAATEGPEAGGTVEPAATQHHQQRQQQHKRQQQE